MSPYDFALIAQESYVAKPDIGVADSASRAIVRQTPAGLVVAFRGSDDIASWLHDFDALTTDVIGVGPVHAGFWDAWQAIATDVMTAINGQRVTLVGHSLGGAIVLCAATEMVLSGHPPTAAWCFESPCISPTSCVADLLRPINPWICRNGSDPVPDVPPLWHAGGVVRQIGNPAGLVPNVIDHEISQVLESISQLTAPLPKGRGF